jgi:general receptor for phosphoinositides 1-associated scaffold protein
MDPHQKYIIKSSTPNSSGEYLVSNASSSLPRSHNDFTISSNENNSYSSLSNQQSPLQRSQVTHHHHHHVPDGSGGECKGVHKHSTEQQTHKSSKARRHYHGHSCNPCMGNFISKRDKITEKDNTSIDAYDLASPCCDPNCVPVKRRSRHHKEHNHKHKHKDKEKERPPRPRSQSHASPQIQTAHVHYENGGKHVGFDTFIAVRSSNNLSKFLFLTFAQDPRSNNHYDLSSQLASHCGLRSCNSNEFCQQPTADGSNYSTSHSTDTLWDPKSDPVQSCNHQNYKQRPNSVYHQPSTSAHSYIHRYVHPSQVQPIQSSITTTHAYIQPQYTSKPKSWDNLAMKGCGTYAIGYVVNNGVTNKHQVTAARNHQVQQQAPPLPRKSGHAPYGRYSTFADVENYVPAPPAYVQEATITKTTIITTKSTENLISNAQYNSSCECVAQVSPKIIASNCIACNAANNTGAYYYSNLARNNSNRGIIPTKTEITRL